MTAPSWGSQQPPGQWQSPYRQLPDEPSRRPLETVLTTLFLLLVVAAVATVGTIAVVRHLDKPKPRSLPHDVTDPDSFLTYRRVNTREVATAIAKMRAVLNEEFGTRRQHVSAYGSPSAVPTVVATAAVATKENEGPTARLSANERSARVNDALNEFYVTNDNVYAAGSFGGLMRCGTGAHHGDVAVVCAWADDSTFGLVFTFGRTTAHELARITRSFRAAAER